MNRFTFLAAVAAVSAFGFVGCDEKREGQSTMPPGMAPGAPGSKATTVPVAVPPATRDAGDAAEDAADDVKDAADDAADATKEGASDASDAAKEGLQNLGKAAEEAGDKAEEAADDATK